MKTARTKNLLGELAKHPYSDTCGCPRCNGTRSEHEAYHQYEPQDGCPVCRQEKTR